MKKLITWPRMVILCLLVIVAIMGAWIFIRGVMVKNLIGGIANLENQNYEIGHGGLNVAGFPFILDASTSNVSIRAPLSDTPDPTKNWSIKSDGLRIHSATLTPLSWNIEHRGQMRIDMRGKNGERYMFDIAPANINAHIVVNTAGKLKTARLNMERAQLDSLVGTPPLISQLGALGADIKISDDIGRVSATGQNFRLSPKIPNILDNILGRKLALVELDADITNWSILETGDTNAWLAANSRLNSEHWAIKWGDADIIGNFNLMFKNGLPEGKIHIRIKKPKPLIQKIIESNPDFEQYAVQANMLISLKETEADGRKSVDITIKNGEVKMGFIPLFKF
ncbi:MAG: DUF2125 domain-containing protein [Robiginitomaculum sp.]|nr:DUF2125 domain-containing protein [Robiginitomaculum sp.]